MSDRFTKLYTMLKGFAIGRRFHRLLIAIEYGKKMHSGTRKDGKTPEFQHQLEIAHYLTTLAIPDDMLEDLLIVAVLHDSDEDETIAFTNMRLPEVIGPVCSNSVYLLNKHRSCSKEQYFIGITKDVLAALSKGADRINNMATMVSGGFSDEKQSSYAIDVRDYFLPMLKTARQNFPVLTSAFYNIETILKIQMTATFDKLARIAVNTPPTVAI